MKEIRWETRFKDVLSSQVALVFRELDQALIKQYQRFQLYQERHEVCHKCVKTFRLDTISAAETANGKFEIDTYHGPRPYRGFEVARLGVSLARSSFAPVGRHFNTS